MIGVETAGELLDFGARINDPKRALEQLQGAVAIHHLLQERKVAYLADEVGMGKTYVALGALALFRHYQPNFRVLIIAPRQNIQRKWMKEFGNFVAHNVRFADLRTKAIDGQSVRERVCCENLMDLVHETSINPDRDFFARLTSFSLPLGGKGAAKEEDANRLRKELGYHFPSLPTDVFDLRDKQGFKDNIARAICSVLPVFDLVIVDEGHNLKHGFGAHVSSRNRVLSFVFGHAAGRDGAKSFVGYGPRATRVLFLSATPVEETYRHLWNQLDVFSRSAGYDDLKRDDVEEKRKKELAAKFLIRRVATIQVNGIELTKNLYRREWRKGGVTVHDEPIRVTNPKQRLVVALIQKKVNELLHQERFSASFQIGMLASFESFLQTAKLRNENDESGVFDDPDQAEDIAEKDGIDVADLNTLARSYRNAFSRELPHPKMDAIIGSLSKAWITGEKALIFVRRTASVTEIKRKLDESFDSWLIGRLQEELPAATLKRFHRAVVRYAKAKQSYLNRRDSELDKGGADIGLKDVGGSDTFFAWFFRGDGPKGLVSGANVQQRFTQRGTTVATFFEDNYVSYVINCAPAEATAKLAMLLGKDVAQLRRDLGERAKPFLSRARKVARGDRYEAVQAAAIEWLKETPGSHQELANIVWHARFEPNKKLLQASETLEVIDELDEQTFFTELRQRPELRSRIWPEPRGATLSERFREQELRARLLAVAARLGHAFLDFYILAITRIGSLRTRMQEKSEEDSIQGRQHRIRDYLALLETRMATPLAKRSWCAFDELSEISGNFDLILDVNLPRARTDSFDEATRSFAQLLGRQQPIGGMAGQVNQTLVGQFRMPGYPFVLITTDLLQEGEDLHTFCSSVHHYGISWTPSSMEQRVGRIDRVRSQTDRRLGRLMRPQINDELLQVYFPHLEDTIEVLQVQRVLERMNTFLRLMHEGLTITDPADRKISMMKEFAGERRAVPQIQGRLRTAFPIAEETLVGKFTELAVKPDQATRAEASFAALKAGQLPFGQITWDPLVQACQLLGSISLNDRQQPFTLLLKCFQDRLLVRCISPVGVINPSQDQALIQQSVVRSPSKIGVILGSDDRSYNLTVEGDVLLSPDPEVNAIRIAQLLRRVTREADRLELLHMPGRDVKLESFRLDLSTEMKNAD
jgi:hypothetical protein